MTAGHLSLEPLPSSCFNVMPVTSQPEQLMCFELGWGSWGRGRLGAGEEEMSREREASRAPAGAPGFSNPFLCIHLSLCYPQGVEISRKIPPLLRNCRLTVLGPLTWVSGIIGTSFNLSSGMWLIKSYEIWAAIQRLPSRRRQHVLKRQPALTSLPSAAAFPFTGITSLNATFNWE